MSRPLLVDVHHLSAGYIPGHPVLFDISFSVEEHERLCVIGPNGCGKTTLLRVLAGILPYEGSIKQTIRDSSSRFCGQMKERSELNSREAARETALLAQLSDTPLPFPVEETILLGRFARQKSRLFTETSPEDRQAVNEAIQTCGLEDIRNHTISALSGGQRQRVYLARALAQEASVLLLDEPTNHLDLHFQLDLVTHIQGWVTAIPRATIGVFHDLALARAFSDRVLLLDEGRIAAWGPAEEVFTSEIINQVYRMNVAQTMQNLLQNW